MYDLIKVEFYCLGILTIRRLGPRRTKALLSGTVAATAATLSSASPTSPPLTSTASPRATRPIVPCPASATTSTKTRGRSPSSGSDYGPCFVVSLPPWLFSHSSLTCNDSGKILKKLLKFQLYVSSSRVVQKVHFCKNDIFFWNLKKVMQWISWYSAWSWITIWNGIERNETCKKIFNLPFLRYVI